MVPTEEIANLYVVIQNSLRRNETSKELVHAHVENKRMLSDLKQPRSIERAIAFVHHGAVRIYRLTFFQHAILLMDMPEEVQAGLDLMHSTQESGRAVVGLVGIVQNAIGRTMRDQDICV